MIELLTDQEIISFEYQRRELVQKRLGRRCTQDELRGLHELDRKLSGRDIGGAFFSEFARLQEENKKLREERDKLVECVKFYANKENWLYSKESHIGGLIVVKDTWTDQPNAGAACFYPEYGGKLARQTLKYIGEEV